MVNHVTEAQARSCGVANGTAQADMVKTPSDTADRDCHHRGIEGFVCGVRTRLFAATTDANFAEMFTLGQNKAVARGADVGYGVA